MVVLPPAGTVWDVSVDLPDAASAGAADSDIPGRIVASDVTPPAGTATADATAAEAATTEAATTDAASEQAPATDLPSADATATDVETVVGEALSVIDALEDLPPADHVERFERVHDVLRAQLSGDA